MKLQLSTHYGDARVITEGQVGNKADFEAAFEVGDVVGRGRFSTVRAVRRRDTGEMFACKVRAWDSPAARWMPALTLALAGPAAVS